MPWETASTVWPSGFAFLSAAAATWPLPPGLFSTITGWPTLSEIFGASMRATWSVPPPPRRAP